MRVLRYLAEQKTPVSGTAVAEALGIKYGTTMCHLATLAEGRFADRVGEHWELGHEVAMLWARKRAQLAAGKSRIENELDQLGGVA